MLDQVLKQLKVHSSFTIFGALSGVIIMLFAREMSQEFALGVFYTLHPMHVVLSALVTSSM